MKLEALEVALIPLLLAPRKLEALDMAPGALARRLAFAPPKGCEVSEDRSVERCELCCSEERCEISVERCESSTAKPSLKPSTAISTTSAARSNLGRRSSGVPIPEMISLVAFCSFWAEALPR